jgi:predicted O-methyltransferase YrrM
MNLNLVCYVFDARAGCEMIASEPINWLGMHREYLQSGEMEIIVALLRNIRARSMAEFGCRDGRTARVLLANVPTLRRYVGIDVLPDYVPSLDHQVNEMVANPGCHAVGDSRFHLVLRQRGTFDLTADDIGPVDAVFIDGDHGRDAVLHDSQLAMDVVSTGGVVIWHDYNDSPIVEVKQALSHLRDLGWPIQLISGTWLAFMRGNVVVGLR